MTNRTPCVRCGFVYPWEGTSAEIAHMRDSLEGRCPACLNKRACPSAGEQRNPTHPIGRPLNGSVLVQGMVHARSRRGGMPRVSS